MLDHRTVEGQRQVPLLSSSTDTVTIKPVTRRRYSQRHAWRGVRSTKVTKAPSIESLTNGRAARAQGQQWKLAYHRRVIAVDALVIIAVVTLAQVGIFGLSPTDHSNEHWNWQGLTALSVILTTSWLIALELQQSRDISLVGVGTEEYRRLVSATVGIFGLVAVSGLLLEVDMSRSYLGIALLLGLIGLVIGRHCLRRRLGRQRLRGEFITRVVVLGKPDSVHVLCESFARAPEAGYRVVGVCIPDYDGEVGDEIMATTGAVPVLGDGNAIESALRLASADALAVAAVEHLGYRNMKKLLWRLESMGTDLIVVPGVTDVAGPRLRMRPIDNLPLFHIAPPHQDGPSALGKRLFDLAFGTVALMVALPIIGLAALAIKLDSDGPVVFRQERVGHRGKRFRLIKLRTMTVDADARKAAERVTVAHTGVFFKSASDSRITRVGRFLRATSIDELPQLLNVLGGSMSMVGPRPLVPGEGESVEDFVERRGHVKPGITGLWQISGRSDVSEEERVRLDHSYVDNWSCVQDLMIVWRTVRAVLKREGAY